MDMLVTGGILESMDFSRVIGDVSLELGLQLKDKQVEAIQKFCEGSDVFVSLPTGFGKSMIYGLLPLEHDDNLQCKCCDICELVCDCTICKMSE